MTRKISALVQYTHNLFPNIFYLKLVEYTEVEPEDSNVSVKHISVTS